MGCVSLFLYPQPNSVCSKDKFCLDWSGKINFPYKRKKYIKTFKRRVFFLTPVHNPNRCAFYNGKNVVIGVPIKLPAK